MSSNQDTGESSPVMSAPEDVEASGRHGLVALILDEHPYVFLGTSAIALIGIALGMQAHPASSFLARSYAVESLLYYLLVAWLVVSAVALVNKLARWKGDAYRTTSPFCRPRARRIEQVCSWIVWAIVGVFVVDRLVVGFADLVGRAVVSTTNPNDFLESSVYMIYNSQAVFVQGIETTIILAVLGTIIAFFLALLLVFLRLQVIDRSDNDFVRFLKTVGVGFARVYSAVVRGTPMMIQGLIIYFAGFGLLRGSGMTVGEISGVWSTFTAALVTVSLNSTAYMMEVLRSGIGAVDPGQTEAARSLGLSQWQAMRTVVFPQGIKNSIPALSNELVINIKDSSVLSVIGVVDLMFATTTIAGKYYRQMQIYLPAALVYLVMTLVASWLLGKFAKHFDPDAEPVVLGTSDAMSVGLKQQVDANVAARNDRGEM